MPTGEHDRALNSRRRDRGTGSATVFFPRQTLEDDIAHGEPGLPL
jgi:hypothetical protein